MLQRLLNLPLAVKAACFAAAICLLTSLLLISAGHRAYRELLHDQADSFGQVLAAQLARNAAVPLLQQDLVSLQAMLARWTQQPLISSGIVYDLDQRIVAAAGESFDPKNQWDYAAEITWEDSSSGRVVIAIDPTPMLDAMRNLSLQLLLLALLLTTLAYAITVVPGRHLDQLLISLRLRLRHAGPRPAQRYPGRDSLADLIDAIAEPPPDATFRDAPGSAIPQSPPINKPASAVATDAGALSAVAINSVAMRPAAGDALAVAGDTEAEDAVATETTEEEPQPLQPADNAVTPGDADVLLLHLDFAQDAQAESCLRWLRAACRLYDAQPVIGRSNGLTALFHGDRDDAGFRALCCAVLLADLCAEDQPHIAVTPIAQAAATSDDGLDLQRHIETLTALADRFAPAQTLCLDAGFSDCSWAATRMQTEQAGPMLRLINMHEPYASVLRRQAASLREQLDS